MLLSIKSKSWKVCVLLSISNYSNSLRVLRKGGSKFHSPIQSTSVCGSFTPFAHLKHTCTSVWIRPEFVPCCFPLVGGRRRWQYQHIDGLDTDLGKVFFVGKSMIGVFQIHISVSVSICLQLVWYWATQIKGEFSYCVDNKKEEILLWKGLRFKFLVIISRTKTTSQPRRKQRT